MPYHIPEATRQKIEALLTRDITDPALIAGRIHRYDLAVSINNRIKAIKQVKEAYYTENPPTPSTMQDPSYTVESQPLSDEALEQAFD